MGITSSKIKKKKGEESEDESTVQYEKLDNSDSSCEVLKLEDVENGDDEDPFAGSYTAKQNAHMSVCDAVFTGIDTNEAEKSLNVARSKSLSLTTNVSPKIPCSEVKDKDTTEAANHAKTAKVSLKKKKKKKASHFLKRNEGDLPALSSGKLGDKAKIRQELEEQGLLTDSYGTDIFGELRGVGIIKESKANHDISDSGEIRRRMPPRLAHLPIDHVTLQERLRSLTIDDAHGASGENREDLKTVERSDKHADLKEPEVNMAIDVEAFSNDTHADNAEVAPRTEKQHAGQVSDKRELVLKIINIESD